ncbi:hypothetical protein KEM60_00172 [Austwickia sp. TVS 96-490-7B]|nr:hypothetical protein [Austwickia sp. TVS 96-490-7B]MBW3083989.1 hypothetical protein [Austwickia sp. TVS 96-490-7B]
MVQIAVRQGGRDKVVEHLGLAAGFATAVVTGTCSRVLAEVVAAAYDQFGFSQPGR